MKEIFRSKSKLKQGLVRKQGLHKLTTTEPSPSWQEPRSDKYKLQQQRRQPAKQQQNKNKHSNHWQAKEKNASNRRPSTCYSFSMNYEPSGQWLSFIYLRGINSASTERKMDRGGQAWKIVKKHEKENHESRARRDETHHLSKKQLNIDEICSDM